MQLPGLLMCDNHLEISADLLASMFYQGYQARWDVVEGVPEGASIVAIEPRYIPGAPPGLPNTFRIHFDRVISPQTIFRAVRADS
jgi:hypothetical protein